MFSGKLAIDKDWATAEGLYAIIEAWIPTDFDRSHFPLVDRFTQSKYKSSAFIVM